MEFINFQKKINTPNNLNYYLKSVALIFILFYISVSSVNYIRANYFYVGKSFDFVIEKDKDKENKKSEKKRNTQKIR